MTAEGTVPDLPGPRPRSRAWRWVRRLVVYPLLALLTVIVAVLVFVVSTRYPQGPAQEGVLALTGVRALVGPDLDPVDGATVVVRDGVIAEVGPAGGVEVPAGAEVVDLDGATVLPGLIDLHIHLGLPELEAGASFGVRAVGRAVVESMRHAAGARRASLSHGVTTVRSLGDDHAWVLEVRRLVEDGELEGPRVAAAGPVMTTPGGHPIATIQDGQVHDPRGVPSTPDEARAAVRDLATTDGGVDLIKVVQDRGGPERPLDPIASDVLAAIVEEAHAHDLPVVAHWGRLDDLDDLLAAGVDGLEHLDSRDLLDGWPEDVLSELVDRRLPLSPTLAVSEAAFAERDPTIVQRFQERTSEFHRAGGWITVGSDAAMPGVPFGGGVHRELALLVEAGLSPREALVGATSSAAQAMRSDEVGVIDPGRAADLLAVVGDPLEDIEAIGSIVAVWREGRLVVDHRD